MNIEKETKEQIKKWVEVRRKRKLTQEDISKITGVSRPNIANFERLRVNNMYLYSFYHNMFGE